MNRRQFLKSTAAGLLLAATPLAFAKTSSQRLPLLPLRDYSEIQPDRISLQLAASSHDFGTGVSSPTLGISANYLGPVLRVKSGQDLPFAVENKLSDKVALHWHGLHIPGNVDGGPHQEIESGDTWRPLVSIKQPASMNWFHSHTHGKTASQVYHGLAGILLIEDDDSLGADLPKTYGVDDFTLVLQDKAFDDEGKLHYELTGEVFEDGFEGDTLLINGAIAPLTQPVPKGWVRLRMLNACNARFLTLSLSNRASLNVIASDGGFLSSPVETEELLISPGERYEVLVDMRNDESVGLDISFEATGALGAVTSIFTGDPEVTALTLIADPNLKAFDGALPKTLARIEAPNPEQAVKTRDFNLNMGVAAELEALALTWGNFCGDGGMGINGQPMNMDRIDVAAKRGDYEIWRITADDMEHPFHIHGCSFRILNERGKEPPAYAQGWKDMVAVQDGVSEVLLKFDHLADAKTPYMYHCHILEHEDCGMMGQFTVS